MLNYQRVTCPSNVEHSLSGPSSLNSIRSSQVAVAEKIYHNVSLSHAPTLMGEVMFIVIIDQNYVVCSFSFFAKSLLTYQQKCVGKPL